MADPLRILVLCTKFPFPPKDGGSVAMMSMIQGFAKAGHQVSVLSMNTPKHFVDLQSLPKEMVSLADFTAVEVNTKVSIVDALANLLFSKESYHVKRFTSKAFREELVDMLKKRSFDVVQLETLFMTPYINSIKEHAPKALIALRAHNVEHEIWSRRATNELNPLKKVVLETTAIRIQAYEEQVLSRGQYDVLVPITGRDAGVLKNMGNKAPDYVCPAGIEENIATTTGPAEQWPSLFYIGALDWEPNLEGMRWFLKQVWPKIRKKYPDLKLYIAGRNTPKELYAVRDPQVVVSGEVDSAADFIRPKGIMIVPILSGSGMRVKILEGMSHGKPIVATPLAAEGLGVRSGEHLYLAQEPQAFADAVSTLIDNPSLARLLADQGADFARKKFSNDKVIAGLLDFYRSKIKS